MKILHVALILTIAGCFLMAGCAKKEEGKKAEAKKAKKVEDSGQRTEDSGKAAGPKAEEPKAEEPKAEESKAEEPKAEEPKAEEPKAEEPKAEEPKAEEPKAEEPKAEEPKAEAPAEVKLVDIDLSTASEDLAIILTAPEGATAKDEWGTMLIKFGDKFQLQFSEDDSIDLPGRKKEIDANTLNKLKKYHVDEEDVVLYESEVMGRTEFHFLAAVKVGEKAYFCEDQKGPTFTKADIEAMLASCKSAKAK